MKRVIPEFKSDQDAIDFLEQDLSDLDFAQFKPVSFEMQPKTARIGLRVSRQLLDAVKLRAEAKGLPINRYLRELLERDARSPTK